MSKVVTNTSPLIVLAKARMLDVLPRIFERVAAPQAVIDEIQAGPEHDLMRQALPVQPWLSVVQLDPPLSARAADQLGAGEAEAIEFARRNEGWSLLVDDRAARRVSSRDGIPTLGTVSVIAMASESKFVPSFEIAASELRKAGLFITDELIELVRQRLGENK